MHYLNMSDHTHLELSLKLTVPLSLPEPSSQNQVRDIKIRWHKCESSLYKEVVQESLLAAPLLSPLSALDADLCVRSLTKVLHVAAKAASPLQRKKSKKISNDQELIQSDPTSCPQNQKGLGRDSQSRMRELQQLCKAVRQHFTDGSVSAAQEVIVDS